MRFLVDRCAGRRLAAWLREQGHDVIETRERGRDPGDSVVLQWAAAENRILITIDSDFGALVFLGGARHCGMVRLPDVPGAQRITVMEELLRRHADDLGARAIVTVRGGRIRIARAAPSG